MVRINREISKIVCVQIPLQFREKVTKYLEKLNYINNHIEIPSMDEALTVILTNTEFSVDASSTERIYIRLTSEENTYLIESIKEHIKDKSGLPLDHSFESLGAQIYPESIKDVVFETIES